MLQATRTTAEGRLFRLLIGALILVSAAAQFALVPVMPVYAHRLGLSGFAQGMVLGATGLATLVVSVPAGTLADRFGARRITLAAGLLMAAATAAQALAGDFSVLFAARLAFGAGYGTSEGGARQSWRLGPTGGRRLQHGGVGRIDLAVDRDVRRRGEARIEIVRVHLQPPLSSSAKCEARGSTAIVGECACQPQVCPCPFGPTFGSCCVPFGARPRSGPVSRRRPRRAYGCAGSAGW